MISDCMSRQKPEGTFTRLFLRDGQFVNEIGPALSGLRLFDVGADRACCAQVLPAEYSGRTIAALFYVPV